MLAPTHQESVPSSSVAAATSSWCATHLSSASWEGSATVRSCAVMCWMSPAIHSTFCSIATGMLDSTDGLCGPVMTNRFGKPRVVRPR